jgi:hypothetical protein
MISQFNSENISLFSFADLSILSASFDLFNFVILCCSFFSVFFLKDFLTQAGVLLIFQHKYNIRL